MGIFSKLFKPNIQELEKRRDVEGLIKAVNHGDRGVRISAAEALSKIKDKKAIEPLIKALNDEDGDVRSSAAEALGKIKDTKAIQPLTKAFKDGYRRVREEAARSLIKIGEIRLVIKALEHGNKNVRKEAAGVLGEIKDKRVIEPLIKALEDKDSHVGANAARSLRNFDAREAKEAIKAYQLKQHEVRIKSLDYIVGGHLAKQGYFKDQIGTEIVGYFDPLKVIFRLFDKNGRRLRKGGEEATALVFPPDCDSEEERTGYIFMASTVAQALEAFPSQISGFYMMSNPLGEMERLLPNLDRISEGEVGKFIFESTVLPFFERYSVGKIRPVRSSAVFREVSMNALFNFLCSEVVRPPGVEDIGVDKLNRRAIRKVRELTKSKQ